jgi:hypothetical protein
VFCGDQLLIPYLRPSRNDAAKNSRALRNYSRNDCENPGLR